MPFTCNYTRLHVLFTPNKTLVTHFVNLARSVNLEIPKALQLPSVAATQHKFLIQKLSQNEDMQSVNTPQAEAGLF